MKQYLPKNLKRLIKRALQRPTLIKLYRYDRRLFQSNVQLGASSADERQISAHLIYLCHQIEKSVSREDFKPGHSGEVLVSVRKTLDTYEARDFDKNNFAYLYILSAIKQLGLAYGANGGDENFLKQRLGKWFDIALQSKEILSGYKVIQKKTKEANQTKNYRDLFNGRFAIREYSKEKVSMEKIKQAVNLSTKTPSACNRQDARVYVLTNEKTIASVLKAQGGMGGYGTPPALILVTSDNRNFINVNERRQGYIDGGLFSMSLLLALEYFGLAACPLHTMFGIKQEKAVRKLINVDESDSLVMLISVGNFKESTRVCASTRMKGEDITTIVG